MYERLHTVYQKYNTENIMYYEPGQYPDKLGVWKGFIPHVGFTTNPGADISSPNHVLNDHTYCCQMSGSECSGGEPKVADAAKCDAWHGKVFSKRD